MVALTQNVKQIPNAVVLEDVAILDAVRAALQAYASLSRIFWPVKNGKRDSAKALRDLCGLAEDHPLSERTLRDHVEHIDERIEAWADDAPRPFMTVEAVDYFSDYKKRPPMTEGVLLVYDAKTNEVCVSGQRYKVADLKMYVQEVQASVSAALVKLTIEP